MTMAEESSDPPSSENALTQFEELLRLIDTIPEIENSLNPLEWDDFGLPE
jgi:hypothetical protein